MLSKVRSKRAEWLKMAVENAELNLNSFQLNKENIFSRFENLRKLLNREEIPERLECFDVSHTMGEATVASCVVFDHGGPLKTDYRRFSIKGVKASDDYAATEQALKRRYLRLKKEEAILPDLLVIDGGKGQIKRAVKTLLQAVKPVIYAGGGVIIDNASDLLVDLARQLNFPVTNTLMGLGAFPGSDPQFLGMLGMHGTYEANMAMHEADVIFAVGARFDDRVTNDLDKFCPSAKIIQIDVDPTSISKNIKSELTFIGVKSSVCLLYTSDAADE